MIYRDEDGMDLRCIPNRHLIRAAKGVIPTRCPVVEGGWCESTTFVVVERGVAERERAGIRSQFRNERARYDR